MALTGAMSCSKADLNANCEKLKSGLLDIESKKTIAIAEINAVAKDIHLSRGNYTYEQIKSAVDLLIARLQGQCGFENEFACYDCVHTLPPQSEADLSFYHNGEKITRVLDLVVSKDDRLECVNIH